MAVDPAWSDVTIVEHHNQPTLGGSVRLTSAEVHSFLVLNNFIVDKPAPGPSITGVNFNETFNQPHANCDGPDTVANPHPGAPPDPLGSQCDDFAIVSGLDLAPIAPLPPFIAPNTGIRFQTVPVNTSTTLVCPGINIVGGDISQQDPRCVNPPGSTNFYGGSDIIIYTAERSDNTFKIQAQIFDTTQSPVPLFVIGDCHWAQWRPHSSEPPGETNTRAVGDPPVNFWGSQWWKNNCMSEFVDNGYPSFKGFATNAVVNITGSPNCGVWQARPGNSGHPPDTLPNRIAIIVTDDVNKQGPNIGGTIKQIVIVDRSIPAGLDNYAGNPGHQGWGTIVDVPCTSH